MTKLRIGFICQIADHIYSFIWKQQVYGKKHIFNNQTSTFRKHQFLTTVYKEKLTKHFFKTSNKAKLILSSVSDHNSGAGFPFWSRTITLNGFHHLPRFLVVHAAKNHVFVVQPWRLHRGNEELRAVGVWTSIGHGQKSRASVMNAEVLVRKSFSIDGITPGSVAIGEISALDHKLRNHSVENGPFVAITIFTYIEGDTDGVLDEFRTVQSNLDLTICSVSLENILENSI